MKIIVEVAIIVLEWRLNHGRKKRKKDFMINEDKEEKINERKK